MSIDKFYLEGAMFSKRQFLYFWTGIIVRDCDHARFIFSLVWPTPGGGGGVGELDCGKPFCTLLCQNTAQLCQNIQEIYYY